MNTGGSGLTASRPSTGDANALRELYGSNNKGRLCNKKTGVAAPANGDI